MVKLEKLKAFYLVTIIKNKDNLLGYEKIVISDKLYRCFLNRDGKQFYQKATKRATVSLPHTSNQYMFVDGNWYI